jgi:tRNA(Ile2) C34 agmatinyltransferase TiaS
MVRREGLPVVDAAVDFDAEESSCPACGHAFKTAGVTRCPDCGLKFSD